MKHFKELNDLLEKEIEKIIKKADITPIEVDNATKAVCLMEKMYKLKELESMDFDNMNSETGRSYAYPYYMMDGRYYDGPSNSYGNSYTRRNPNTGRYMSMDRGPSSRDGAYYGTFEGGYSGHSIKDRMIAKLESMMDETNSEHERQAINEWINKLEH